MTKLNGHSGLNFYANALILSSNMPDTAARILGLNARVGFRLTPNLSTWTVRLMTGMYYSQMFVTQNKFGYSSLLYPQLFLTAKRTLSPRNDLSVYAKFASLSASQLISLTERELAFGLVWDHWFFESRPVAFSLDWVRDSFKMSTSVNIISSVLTLGVGTSF